MNGDIARSFEAFLAKEYPGAGPLVILTLSASSTVSGCLLDAISATQRTLDIRVLESRPLFEGAFRVNVDDEGAFALSDHLPQLAVFGGK